MRQESDSKDTSGATGMTQKLLELLRDRVATRYYDRPDVIDAVARAMVGATWIGRSS
jgi:hypothetical protein